MTILPNKFFNSVIVFVYLTIFIYRPGLYQRIIFDFQ